jgi:transcriptional antiterminator NusG
MDETDTPDPENETADVQEPAPVLDVQDTLTDEPAGDDAVADDLVADDLASDADEPVEVLTEDDVLDETPPPAPRESPYDRPGRWYVVHSYAGYENKVKADLENRIQAMNMEERIYEVVIPMEEVVEIKNGKKQTVQKKLFPGYLRVRCDLDDDAWYVVRNTPGVTGFVGPGTKPSPLGRRDVENFLGAPVEGEEDQSRKPRTTTLFQVNDPVRVLTGPFADFPGMVAEIKLDQQRVKVLVDIFGRETPVELGFDDIAKL